MCCTRESPCGGMLRVVLTTPDFIIEECIGSAHSYRSGVGAFDKEPERRGRFAHLVNRPRVIEADLVLAPKDPACRYCRRSDLGACSRHGGLSKAVRDRVHFYRYSLRRNRRALAGSG